MGDPFADMLVDWENDTARYEIQSGKQFADDYRVATLLVHAPEPARTVLRNAPPAAKLSYAALREHLRQWHMSGLTYSGLGTMRGDDPMEGVTVGAVSGQKAGVDPKGKGGKGDKGDKGAKGKFKGDKGKGKKGKYGKNEKGKKGEKGDRKCFYCNESGHYQSDCPKKKADQKAAGVSSQPPAQSQQAVKHSAW